MLFKRTQCLGKRTNIVVIIAGLALDMHLFNDAELLQSLVSGAVKRTHQAHQVLYYK